MVATVKLSVTQWYNLENIHVISLNKQLKAYPFYTQWKQALSQGLNAI